MILAEISLITIAGVVLVCIGTVVGRILFGTISVENKMAELEGKISALEGEQVEMKLILEQIVKKLKIGY